MNYKKEISAIDSRISILQAEIRELTYQRNRLIISEKFECSYSVIWTQKKGVSDGQEQAL